MQDTGVGISVQDQGKLFKLFGMLEDNKQLNTHGIGLGLVISQQIVEIFGGKISLLSKPEEGSKFTFTFQLEEPSLRIP